MTPSKSVEMVLWAKRKGAEDWQTELITSTTSADHLAKAKEWAIANGFVNLRVSEFRPGDKPDFIGAINKGAK